MHPLSAPVQLNYYSSYVLPVCTGASQRVLRMFSQRFTSDWVIYILSGHLISRRYSRTAKAPGTHLPGERAEGALARKQVCDQSGLTESVWCLHGEICPRNLFHILDPHGVSAPLRLWRWWIFQTFWGKLSCFLLFSDFEWCSTSLCTLRDHRVQ